ncbi:MAG: InlB B-repeat-containing protein [Firmicutes bacterium]|nr:InlB B-repeat-containing protein [Bacillota bacterium]
MKRLKILIPFIMVFLMIMGAESVSAAVSTEFLSSTDDITVISSTAHDIIYGVREGELVLQKSNGGKVKAHVILVKPYAKAKFKAITPGYYKSGSTKATRTAAGYSFTWGLRSVSGMVSEYNSAADTGANPVLAAVNGDFFVGSSPRGSVIMEGREYIGPYGGYSYEYFFAKKSDGAIGILERTSPQKSVVEEAICGPMHILYNGQLNGVDKEVVERQRTGVAIKPNGDTLMITVESGISVKHLAKLMQASGCWNGLNLDGGGSITFLSKRNGGTLTKRTPSPGSGYPLEGGERKVSTALMLVADNNAVANNVNTPSTPSLTVDKTKYTCGEPIKVTASTDKKGAWVGLYKEGDDINSMPSYFWYYTYGVNQYQAWSWESGKTYDIFTEGQCNNRDGAVSAGTLPVGKYKVVLIDDSTGTRKVLASKSITVVADTASFSIKTDKDVYAVGDPIMTTMTAPVSATNAWAGIVEHGAKVDDTYPTFFWYYNRLENSGIQHENGVAYNILKQSMIGDIPSKVNGALIDKNQRILKAGKYDISVFLTETNYSAVATKTITIVDPNTSYKITYKDKDGKTLSGLTPSSYTYNTAKLGAVALPKTATKTGYNFGGWYTNSGLTGQSVTSIPKDSTGDKVFYAKFDPKTYDVYFDSKGGTEVANQVVSYGKTATAPTNPTRAGYTFDGWTTSSSGSGTSFNFSTTITSNITLYAKWKANGYSITYKDGSTTMTGLSPTSYTVEAATTLPTAAKTGYTFLGWYDNADGTGSAITVLPKGSTGNKTFYAKFKVNTYTVTFDTKGGSKVPSVSIKYDKNLEEEEKIPPNPTKTGYTFKGWVTASGSKYNFSTKVTGNITIYAKWEENKYTVTFNSEGGSNVTSQTVTYGQKASVPTNPTRKGYNFGGWVTTSGGTTAFNFNNAITTNVTAFAKWNPITYKISFESNGGTTVAYKEYTIESATITLPTISKTGYNFGGWYSNSACSGSAVTKVAKGSTGNKTFYAKWTAKTYTVTFDTKGGSQVDAVEVSYGSTVSEPGTPTRTGYTFEKWETSSGGLFNFATAITTDTTIYAKWKRNTYTVRFDTDGGSAIDSQSVLYEGKVARPANNPTKLAYSFVGWVTTKGGTETFDFNQEILGDTIVYAKWKLKDKYTVSFVTGSESVPENQAVQEGKMATKPATPEKNGFNFENWYKDADLTEAFDFSDPIMGNTTIYAKWNPVFYNITYNANGGDPVQADTYTIETETFVLPSTTKNGYRFLGWKAADGTPYTSIEKGSTGNLSLTARWQEIKNIAIDKPEYNFEDTIHVTTNYEKAGAWVGLYKVGETPGADNYILKYDVPAAGTTEDLYTSRRVTRNEARNEFYKDTGKLKSGAYEIYIFKDSGTEILEKMYFSIATKMDGEPVVTLANCTKAGVTTIYYTDGTVVMSDSKSALGHDLVSATCEDKGYCQREGCDYETGLALGHKMELVTEKASSCTEDGNVRHYVCEQCDGYFEDEGGTKPLDNVVISAPGHNMTHHNQVNPTCEEDGTKGYYYCDACQVLFEDEDGKFVLEDIVIEKTGHVEGEAATCTQPQHCAVCDEELQPALGHTEGPAATCTTDQNCTVCGELLAKAFDHTAGAAPSCTEAQRCITCEEVLNDALGHKIKERSLCTEKYQCSVCNKVLAEGNDHVPGAAATCTTPQRCLECSYVIEAVKPHDFSPANCQSEKTCWTCGKKEGSLGGHVADKDAPTCTEGQYCTICDKQLSKALGHKKGAAATCTTDQNCTACGELLVKAFGHTEGAAATCMTPQKCLVCQLVLEEPDPLLHESDSLATCTKDQICKVCKEVLSEAHGHTESVVKGQEPTCTETGLTDGKMCSVCLVTLQEREIIPANGHNPGAPATCLTTQRCMTCQAVLEGTVDHIPGPAATCTTAQSCTECGHALVPGTGHSAGAKATCTTPQTCKKCDTVLKKALGHAWIKGSCTEDTTCSRCDERIAAPGHTLVETEAVEATCSKTGLTAGEKCSTCGKVTKAQDVIEMKAHTETVLEGKEPTCTESGLTEGKICSVCNTVTQHQDVIAKKNHKQSIVSGKAATCTEPGLTDGRICTVCNATTLAQKEIPMTGHNESATSGKAATCTENGYTDGVICLTCNEVLEAQDIVAALGHNESVISGKEATCMEDGITDGVVCLTCNKTLKKQETIAALGHQGEVSITAATDKQDGQLLDTCNRCNLVLSKQTITAIDKIKLSCKTYAYNGKVKTPTITVKDKKGNIISDAFYTVEVPEGRKNVGTYTYTITFKEQYAGTSTLKMTVNPAKPTKLTVAGKKNAVTVKWKKVSNQATGYEVMYSTSKTFKKGTETKTKKIKKIKTTNLNINKLKAKKTYYVKIRTYKLVGKTKYYSSWSAVKQVKTK